MSAFDESHEGHTVVDKRHHQSPVNPVETKAEAVSNVVQMKAPQAPETPEADTEKNSPVTLEDLAFGLLIGHDKAKNDMVFQVVGNPTLADILGMAVLFQDRVDEIKDQFTHSVNWRRDQQFMVTNKALSSLIMQVAEMKKMMLARK